MLIALGDAYNSIESINEAKKVPPYLSLIFAYAFFLRKLVMFLFKHVYKRLQKIKKLLLLQ